MKDQPNITNAAAAAGDVTKLTSEEDFLAHLVADMRNGHHRDERWQQLEPILRTAFESGRHETISLAAKFLRAVNEERREHQVRIAARDLGCVPWSDDFKNWILDRPEKYGDDWPDFCATETWANIFRRAGIEVRMSTGGRPTENP